MKRYIKFDKIGGKAIEAPKVKKTDKGTVFGYNTEANEEELLKDGYMIYTGSLPLSKLAWFGGEIIEQFDPPADISQPMKFTKLQIRRCMRKHGIEDQLDAILTGNVDFKKDWDDCLDIDLNDEMMQSAIESGIISQELISLIQSECEGTY